MAAIGDYVKEVVEYRRSLHRRPEEGWTEFETSWLVLRTLREHGFAVRFGEDVVDPALRIVDAALIDDAMERARAAGVPEDYLQASHGITGVVGDFDTGRPGPLTALRFDMDCVCVEEGKSAAHEPARLGFSSERPGLMHACGHDGHTAVGLGIAHWIRDNAEQLCGRFRLIFQPAEEGTRGARAMASRGIVDDVDYFFGAHVGMYCRSGEVGVCKSGFLATTKLDIEFTGVASHAGAEPNKGKSALVAACMAVAMMQGIPRHADGETRIAVGTLHAGEGRNVTPVHALLQAEVRGATHEVNQFMLENVRNIVKGVESAYGVKAELRIVGEATTLDVTDEGTALIEAAASSIPGIAVKELDHLSGSEDCTIFIRRAHEHGAQTGFFLYGCDNNGHHRPDFDLQDEQNLPVGLAVFAQLLEETNARRG